MNRRQKRQGVSVPFGNNIRQRINTTAVAASLLADTHNAQPNTVSEQLLGVRSVRQQTDDARAAQKSAEDDLANESNINCSDWGSEFDSRDVSNFSEEDHDSPNDGSSYYNEDEMDDSSVKHGGADVGDSEDDQLDNVRNVEFL